VSTTLHTPYLAETWKILYLDPSLFVCQLYWCSSKHNNNKALRITFDSCKTVSTYSMALATVNVDKIIKVTSASSYVLHWPVTICDVVYDTSPFLNGTPLTFWQCHVALTAIVLPLRNRLNLIFLFVSSADFLHFATHTRWTKNGTLCFVRLNFVKYWPIFKLISLSESGRHFKQYCHLLRSHLRSTFYKIWLNRLRHFDTRQQVSKNLK